MKVSFRPAVVGLVVLAILTGCGSPTVPVPSEPAPASMAPAPSPSPQAATTPSPTPPPEWALAQDEDLISYPIVAEAGVAPAAEIRDSTMFHDRIVAVGVDPLGGAVWSSSDGKDWERIPPDPDLDEVTLVRIAASADVLLAVAATSSGWVVLRSTDGRDWQETGAKIFDPGPDNPFYYLQGLTSGPSGFVISSTVGGDCSDVCPPRPSTMWRSRDGRQWSSSVIEPPAATGPINPVRDVIGTPNGYLAVGSAVWSSTDGLSWRIRTTKLPAEQLDRVFLINDEFLALPGMGLSTAVFRSPDGVTWTAAPLPVSGGQVARSVVHAANGYVAVGAAYNETSATRWPRIWTSEDGSHWQLAGPSTNAVGELTSVVTLGGSVLALGTTAPWTEHPGNAAVWIQPAVPTPAPAPRPVVRSEGTWRQEEPLELPEPAAGQVFLVGLRAFGQGDRLNVLYDLQSDTEGGDVTGVFARGLYQLDTYDGARLPGARGDAVSGVSNGRIVVLGGTIVGVEDALDVYDIARNRWAPRRRIRGLFLDEVGAVLSDGRIMIVSPEGEGTRVVDPRTLTVSKLRRGPSRERPIQAYALAGSRVLVLTTTRAWIVDVPTGRWSAGPIAPRVGGLGPGTVLRDGRVALLRSSGPERPQTWVDIVSADGTRWTELETTGGPTGPQTLTELDEGELVALRLQESCDTEGTCVPTSKIEVWVGTGLIPGP